MNLFPEHITLNGREVLVNEMIRNPSQITGQEKDLADFLKEWYAPMDFLVVKTSGSTGLPKEIRLSREFMAFSARRTLKFFQLEKNNPVLHCLSIKFIAGKMMVVRALLGQLNLILEDPSTDFSILKNSRFPFAAMVPNQVSKVLQNDNLIQNIDQLLIGGSAIPASLERKLQAVTTECYSGYAMTETASHIALRKINGPGKDSYYHCMEKIQVQLSANGCLQIFMPGLHDQPLHTNDLAEVKDEKTFRILGRHDNVIISGGIKYSPEQLEKKLEPYIKEPFLISSLPHETLGQQLVLVVEGKENKQTIEKLKEICRKQLNRYEQPKQILFINKLPCLPNSKPDRRKIR